MYLPSKICLGPLEIHMVRDRDPRQKMATESRAVLMLVLTHFDDHE